MAYKSADLEFEKEWNKAAAWAQSQGIAASSYLSVYEQDANRLAAGDSPMSAGERNRAILAAHNPNDVTPLPTDNPSPSSVLGNMRTDLGSILTGLEPQHLIANIFDTAVNTVKDVLDPAKLVGVNIEDTGANLLQDTLLSFVPGAYDVGTFLRAGGVGKGLDALAEHPLVSLLDMLPAGSSKLLTGALADTAAGARLADAAGVTTEGLKGMSPLQAASRALQNIAPEGKFAKVGLGPDATKGIHTLTIGERFQNLLGNSALGTNKAIQKLSGEYMLNNQMGSNLAQSIYAPALSALSALKPDELTQFDELFHRQRMGDDIQRLLEDPTIPIPVRDAAIKFINGPLAYEREEAIMASPRSTGGKPDVVPILKPDGSLGLYAGIGADSVKNARDTLETARKDFTEGLAEVDPLKQRVDKLDAMLPQLASGLDQLNQAARQATQTNENLLSNIVTESEGAAGKMIQQRFGTQRRQAEYFFGQGGVIDGMVDAAKSGNVDRMGAMATVVRSRLNRWGAHSVDAAADPAFTSVRQMIDNLDAYSKQRTHLNTEIDRKILGGEKQAEQVVRRQRALQAEQHATQRSELTEEHRGQREKLAESRRRALSEARADYQIRVGHIRQIQQMEDLEDRARADNAAARAKPGTKRAIRAEITAKIRARKEAVARELREEARKNKVAVTGINRTWDRNLGELNAKQQTDRAELTKIQKEQLGNVGGELTQQARSYTMAVKDFHKAVFDNPTDEYRDAKQLAYEQALLDGEHNAELTDAAFTRLRGLGWDETRIEQFRSDPVKLGEYVSLTAQDIYENPLNFDPELVDAVKEARDDASKSALTEIQTLIHQGFKPTWLPSAGPEDRVSSAIRVTVGKGVPHVDTAHARAELPTNTRYDVVAGMSKAMVQRITRDATIDFVEHSIVPRSLTGSQLRDIMDSLQESIPEQYEANAEKVGSAYSRKLADLGLTKVDPLKLFGFSFPRWEGDALYMPTSLVRALEKMTAEERGERSFLEKALGKETRLFRYSILGLSPRYTAHIFFGGTFLLALRSTPYMPFMLRNAAKALKDGSIPDEVFRGATQEGFSEMATALNAHGKAAGKQLGNLAIQEDLTLRQKVMESKASPIHWLKAAADINFRFTRHVVAMQQAVAYLDYASSAERRGFFHDEVTGEKKVMTRERAMVEGMKHVESVYGNLRSMSPLERQISKTVMPFYGWSRHIINYVLRFPADHPWRAMVLALAAYEDSANVPKGLPERIQFLFFLGSPNANGQVSAVDTRFMDPLRDVANYASLGGWLESLNPALIAPLAIMDPQAVYGSNELYPNLTYNQFYGIETASNQGNALTGLEQFVPQLGAVQPLAEAIKSAGNIRKLTTNPNSFYKSIFESLNIPFAQVQSINVKQIAASDEIARYQVAKQASANAFQSGDFSSLAGYATVPNPLNPDYDITPAQLQALYNEALAAYPGQAPIETLTPPPEPPGF